MKKVFQLTALFLCITIIASCFTGTAVLAVGTSSNSEFVIKNGVLTRYNGKDGKVVIPEGVKKIDSLVFFYNSNITDVVLSNTVSEIDAYTFSSCNTLKSISVANNNNNFSSENGVLFNKDKSKMIKYPPASKQKSYQIPQGVTDIDNDAFSRCNNLCSIQIPDTAVSLCNFSDCDHLAAINVSNTNLNYCSQNGVLFSKDKSELLSCPPAYPNKTYVIPNSVIQIADHAFSNCNKLTDITIPNSVKSIGNYAFQNCDKLGSIKIPNSVTKIGINAFFRCSQLSQLSLPSGLSDIGCYAFDGTPWLDKFTGDTVIVNHVLIKYKGDSSKVIIPNGILKISGGAFSNCDNVKIVTIPDSVTVIENNAFSDCNALKNITIPKSVSEIGYDAIEANTVIVGYEGSAAQAYAQKNGNKFQLVGTQTAATSSSVSNSQSTPVVTASIKDLSSPASLPPVSLAVIIIGAVSIGVCIFLSIKKRNRQRRQSAQPENIVSGTSGEYSTAEPKPVDCIIPQPDKIICGQCGRSCPTEALFCPNCGHEMKTS